MRYFLAVAEAQSFRGAAARLNVSQPPLSRAIAKLEQEIGVALFERGARRVFLTEAGQAFRPEAAGIIAQAERAIGAARGHPAPGQTVSVAFEGSSIYDVVPRALGRLREERPDLLVKLADMTTAGQVRALVNGDVDVGFVVPPVRHPGLVITEVWRDELVLLLPLGHRLAGKGPLGLAELADEPFVTGSRHDQCGLHLSVLALCRAAGFVPRVSLDVNDMGLVLGFVAVGIGLALLPRSVAGARADLVALPLRPRASAGLAVAHRRGDDAPAVQSLLALAAALGQPGGADRKRGREQ